MKLNSRVSVIVPVYNAGPYLQECIGSILNGHDLSLELILVNDGSTDSSGEICRHCAAHDPRVKLIEIPNSGVSVARNTGIDAASCDWIIFCDADDRLYPGAIDKLAGAIHCSGLRDVDMVVCDFDYAKEYKEPRPAEFSFSVHTGRDALARTLYQEAGWEVTPTKLYRKTLFDKCRFAPGHRYEDLMLIPILMTHCRTVIHLDEKLFFYRCHRGSFINSDSPERCHAVEAVRAIAEAIPAEWTDCADAAVSRMFSAAFNLFAYASRKKLAGEADRTWDIVRKLRRRILTDSRARAKNRIGALISYLGRPVSELLCSWIYR